MKIPKIIQNISLLFRVYFYVFMHGTAKKVPNEIKSICIVQVAKLGDMICTTPMFRAIKIQYPNAMVTVVGDALNKEVLAGNSDVDAYIIWRNDVLEMKGIFQAHRFDAACITTPNAVALASLYLAGVRSIVVPRVENGWCPTETRFYKVLRNVCLTAPHRMGQYAPREYLRLLEPLGIHAVDTKKHLGCSDAAREKVEVFLRDHDLVGKKFAVISPSAGNKIKRWPPDRFARVAEYLVATHGSPVVVIGGKRDREEVEVMMREIKNPEHIINALEKFSIDELKAFIAKAMLFVSVDTGPIYIAEAFGVATVDITGPVDEHEQPPVGPRNIVVVPSNRKKPELFVLNAKMYNTEEAIRQTESITVADVIGAIDLLNLNK